MKKSKLFKLITLPSLATVITVAPLTLCQCGNNSETPSEPTIDPTVSAKVTITTKTDSEGNSVSTLTPKSSTSSITDVKVMIGSDTLIKDTDYKVSGLSSNGQDVVVTIFKAALSKYTGDIVIKPTVKTSPAVLTSISCDSSPTKTLNESLYTSDVIVYAHYSDSTKIKLDWSTGYKIYDSTGEEITNFGSGYKLTTLGTVKFTIKAVSDSSKIDTLTVNVIAEAATITFVPVGGTLGSYTTKVEKGTLWGSVSKPSTTASYGYNNTVTWRNGSASGSIMQASDPINSSMSIYACFEERPTTSKGTKTCDTSNSKLSPSHTSYMPSENYDPDNETYFAKMIQYENDSRYTFKIELDGSTLTNVRYFWIAQKKSSGNQLYMFQQKTVTKNIVSVKHDSVDIGYTLYNNNGGNYLCFSSTYSSGTIEITVDFHETANTPLKFIPAFETVS